MSIFTKIFDWIRKIPAHIEPLLVKSLTLSTALRAVLTSPVGDIATAIIPGTWDDIAKQEAINILNDVIPAVQIHEDCGSDINCWAAHLAQLPQDVQDAIVFKFASKVLSAYDTAQLAQHKYDTYIQLKIAEDK